MFKLKKEYTEYENKSLRLPKDFLNFLLFSHSNSLLRAFGESGRSFLLPYTRL